MPGYDDICNDPNAYVLWAANTNLRGDPWQKTGQVLVRLVADVLTAIEKKLTSERHASAQKTRDWFQAQHKTLIALGVSIAREARNQWEPQLAGRLPIGQTLQAIERVVPAILQDYPGDEIAIREWYSAYDRLVFVVGVSVTTVLMLADALGESTDDAVNRDADDADEVEVENDESDADDDEDDSVEAEDDGHDEDGDQDADGEEDEDSEDTGEDGGHGDGDEEDTDEGDKDEDDGDEADSGDDDYSAKLEGDVSDEEDDHEENDPEDENSDEDPDDDDDE